MRTDPSEEWVIAALAHRDPHPEGPSNGADLPVEARKLLQTILRSDPADSRAAAAAPAPGKTRSLADSLRRLSGRAGSGQRLRGLIAVGVVALIVLLIAGPAHLLPSSALRGPRTFPYQAAHPFDPAGTPSRTHAGQWRLLDAKVSGTWEQHVLGPPPGDLTCASPSACYVIAGKYASPTAKAPLSEALYVSRDLGATWSVVAMPGGFSPTSQLSCPLPGVCAVGGTLHHTSVLLVTTDSASQWTAMPTKGVSGELLELACISATTCDAISGPSWAGPRSEGGNSTKAKPREAFVTTTDAGESWSISPLPPTEYVVDFSCTNAEHCLVLGRQGTTSARQPTETDLVSATSNAGRSWSTGSLPEGFSLGPTSGLSCPDAKHCFLVGSVPVRNTNPSACNNAAPTIRAAARPVRPPAMSSAVAAISATESRLEAKAASEESASKGGISCLLPADTYQPVSDIASSSDGGLTWSPEIIPRDVPVPQLDGIYCPSAASCWASGSEMVLQQVGNGYDLSSSVLLGTDNGGGSWSKVVFSVPHGAPDPFGQSFIAIGGIDCPSANACVAVGAGAQGASTSPVYSLVSATQ